MSIATLWTEIRNELTKLLTHADPEVQAVAQGVSTRLTELEHTIATDAPALVHEAEQDASHLATEAVTDVENATTAPPATGTATEPAPGT